MTNRTHSVGIVYPSRPHDPTNVTKENHGHPAHRGFARSVAADTIPMVKPVGSVGFDSPLHSDLVSAMISPIPRRDVFLLENDSVLYVAPRLKEQFPDSTVILLAAADRLIGERDDVEIDRPRPDQDIETLVDRTLLRQFLKQYCDGAIAVSSLVARRLRSYVPPEFPIRVVNPYIQPEVFAELRSVEPDLAAERAVTVCQGRDHKGMDFLVATWPAVRARHPGAELRIIGPGHPTSYEKTSGVTVCGYVEDLRAELARASLYIHPAKIEPFGVSVIEALCAGVPALVTETTGAREAVRAVNRSLVVPRSPSGLVGGVCEYFETPLECKRALSTKGRQVVSAYTEAIQLRRFQCQFRAIVDAVRRTFTPRSEPIRE